MKNKVHYLNHDISIPNILNIIIMIFSISSMIGLIYLCSSTTKVSVKLFCFIAFGFVGNTTFSLLHESVHGYFNSNEKINYLLGNVLAAFFPTGYSLQKHCHLNHHRHNRTDFEMFESYHENDSYILKSMMLYFILTGVYWLSPPLGSLWLLIHPNSLLDGIFSGKNYKVGRIGTTGMLRNLKALGKNELTKIRLEILFSLLLQVLIFKVFNFSLAGWLICYVGFAIQWSGLQYADHAYSARDVRNGAWNLKVSKVTQYFYLNYHHHLAHHQHPNVPWIHLEKFVDFNEERPRFWDIYLRMWKGLSQLEQKEVILPDSEFDQMIQNNQFNKL